MNAPNIEADDEIVRCVIFPKHFQDAVHTDAAFLSFGPAKEDGASHESGVLCKLHPTDHDVHEVGCRIASHQNTRLEAEVGSLKRRYYCGFRKALAKDVAVVGDDYRVVLTLDGENGEASHIDIALHIQADTKNKRATIKTEVGLVLSERFGPVHPHLCANDVQDANHPVAVDPTCLTRGIPNHVSLQRSLPFEPPIEPA